MVKKETIETRKVKLSCVTLGPHELNRIATLLYEEAQIEKRTPEFTIECKDGSSFKTNDPATFEEANMPIGEIESIHMHWYNYEGNPKGIDVQLRYHNDIFGSYGNYIEVSGIDSTWVNGITAKFQNLIIQYRNKRAILYRLIPLRWLFLYLLLGGVPLLLFWLWLAPINDEWLNIALPVSLSLGYLFTLGLDPLLHSTFPNIEIRNARGSRAEKRRKALYWIIAIIVIPLLAGIIAGLIVR